MFAPYIRKYMIFSMLIGALLFSIFIIIPAYAKGVTPIQTTPPVTTPTMRSITVNGAGTASITPDIAYITLGVTTDAKSAREALTQNNTQMQALMKSLQTAGIANADIRTQGVQLYPRYDLPGQTTSQPEAQPTGQPNGQESANRLTGFTASNTVEVTVRKIDNLGQILDQAVTAGSNQIQGIRFDVANPATAMDQARQAAMQDATHKAEQLAGLAKASLGAVVTINESSSMPIPYAADARMEAAASSVPVSPGTQQITVNIMLTWELQ